MKKPNCAYPMTPSWQQLLSSEKNDPYFVEMIQSIQQQQQQGDIIYPASNDIFNAFKLTPLTSIKVVILGQDPYHGPNQAHGLCFSVQQPTPPPPSLKNIFKELMNDGLIHTMPKHGNLTNWATQGVFLLNSVLTVKHQQANSHANIGWQRFTDHVIQIINNHTDHVVFMLWGNQAQQKAKQLDQKRHLILTSSHPSPLSAHRGFLGCKHFSRANDYLKQHQKTTINWSLETFA